MSAIAVQTPAPRARMTRPKRAQIRFLECLREGMTVTDAAEHTAVKLRSFYRWRNEDPDFAAQWEEAYEQGTDALERVAQKRAVNGSDTLLIFLLKARRPTKFRDRGTLEVTGQVEHTGTVEIEDRSASLADVARVLEAVGAIAELGGATPPRALPAAP